MRTDWSRADDNVSYRQHKLITIPQQIPITNPNIMIIIDHQAFQLWPMSMFWILHQCHL